MTLVKLIDFAGGGKKNLLKIAIASSAIAISTLTIVPVQAANLIQNGSFETATVTPSNPPGFLTLNVGSTAITGWTVTQGTIDYVDTANWQAADGNRSLDLDGTFNSAGGIQQTFNTIIGSLYRVIFDMAGNPTLEPPVKNMRVSAAGTSSDFSFDVTGKSGTNMGWVSKSWDFTATSTTTTLEFISLTGTGAGPALDNVSVVEVSSQPSSIPEPSSILGILSLGVLGIGSALKRQS